MFLIDTNIISEVCKGARCNVRMAGWCAGIEDTGLYLSVLVTGEIQKRNRVRATARPRDPRTAELHFGRIAEIEQVLFDFDEHGDLRVEVRFRLRPVQLIDPHPVRDDLRHRRPHRHAFLPNLEPQLTETFRVVNQEGRAAFGVSRRHVAEPGDSVPVSIRAEPPPPERGGRLEEGQQIGSFALYGLVHSLFTVHISPARD